MSLLKIHISNSLEFQKQSYQNLCNSVLEIDENYIPAWYFEPLSSSETFDHVELRKITDINELISNRIINDDIIDSNLSVTVNSGNGFLYADKLSYTLEDNTFYLLLIETNSEQYYSELFKKI